MRKLPSLLWSAVVSVALAVVLILSCITTMSLPDSLTKKNDGDESDKV